MRKLIVVASAMTLAALFSVTSAEKASAAVAAPVMSAAKADTAPKSELTKVQWRGGHGGGGGWRGGPGGWRGGGWRGGGWRGGGWRGGPGWRGWGWGAWPYYYGAYPYYGPGPYYGAAPCCDGPRPYGPPPSEPPLK